MWGVKIISFAVCTQCYMAIVRSDFFRVSVQSRPGLASRQCCLCSWSSAPLPGVQVANWVQISDESCIFFRRFISHSLNQKKKTSFMSAYQQITSSL